MSFESALKNGLLSDTALGSGRYTRCYKNRQNISKSRVELYNSAIYLNIGGSATLKYTDSTSVRYIACAGMTYDTLLSIFDINSSNLFAARFATFTDRQRQAAEDFMLSIKRRRPRFEARIIGMQNSEEYKDLYKIADMLSAHRIGIYEIDLFGSDVRNVALDSKLGVSYEMLMEDRLYRPGELANNMTVEQFEKMVRSQDQQSRA